MIMEQGGARPRRGSDAPDPDAGPDFGGRTGKPRRTTRRVTDAEARGTPNAVFVRLSVLSSALLVLGLTLARPDLVALAAPFTIGLFASVLRRGRDAVHIDLAIDRSDVVEGNALAATLTMRSTSDIDAVILDVRTGPGMLLLGHDSRRAFAVSGGEEVVVDLGVYAARWGRTSVGPVQVSAYGAGLAFDLPGTGRQKSHLNVLPRADGFASEASLPNAVTSAGTHRSWLRGDGMDLAGVRPFVYGDRLRRVEWRISRRLGTLHVVEAHTERSSEVVVLVDSGQDVGSSGGVGGATSSLDAAVRAAAGVTARYLARGDAVRIVDVGTRLRFLRRLAGRRDLVIACEWLLDTRMAASGDAWAPARVAALVPPRALVLALTPLLDERMTTLVARLRQRGQPIVVVDTLPPDALPADLDTYEQLALRMWLLEREQTIALLVESGCPVVPWQNSGGVDAALRALAFASMAPRMAAR